MARSLEAPCREWQGARNSRGYGVIWREGRLWLVHRWVWTLANGPIPKGMHACHRCDNRPCFMLDHLFLGTHADNMADMVTKGRAAHSNALKTHCPQGHPYDEENTYIMPPNGARVCRTCSREKSRRWKEKRRSGKVA